MIELVFVIVGCAEPVECGKGTQERSGRCVPATDTATDTETAAPPGDPDVTFRKACARVHDSNGDEGWGYYEHVYGTVENVGGDGRYWIEARTYMGSDYQDDTHGPYTIGADSSSQFDEEFFLGQWASSMRFRALSSREGGSTDEQTDQVFADFDGEFACFTE